MYDSALSVAGVVLYQPLHVGLVAAQGLERLPCVLSDSDLELARFGVVQVADTVELGLDLPFGEGPVG